MGQKTKKSGLEYPKVQILRPKLLPMFVNDLPKSITDGELVRTLMISHK